MEKAYVKDKEENVEVRWVLRIRVKTFFTSDSLSPPKG